MEKKKHGFAAMNKDDVKRIASAAGKLAHVLGRAHQFTSETAREAGRKGGLKVSADRTHMSKIGKKGGELISQDRAFMAKIGKMGGSLVSQNRAHMSKIGVKGAVASTERESIETSDV